MSAKVSATRGGEPPSVANLFCPAELQERETGPPTDEKSAQTEPLPRMPMTGALVSPPRFAGTEIELPPGKLGVVFESGSTRIKQLRDDSPLAERVRLEHHVALIGPARRELVRRGCCPVCNSTWE